MPHSTTVSRRRHLHVVPPPALGLDDTSRCPLDRRCATCSTENDLAIGTAISQVGVHCVTLCGRCAERGDLPRLAPLTAAAAVAEHCGHLNIDLDQAAAILEHERNNQVRTDDSLEEVST